MPKVEEYKGLGHPEKLLEMLKTYKEQLLKAGFEVVEMPTTWENVYSYKSYTNSIPINSKEGTQVIVPSFGQVELEARISSILKENGITSIFVPNETFKYGGNTHCITGALQFSEIRSKKY